MLPRHYPDRIRVSFDDHRLVANAGLILPATLALRLGLPELVRQRLDLGNAPGRANTGDKMMTLVASALAGGDCIDDADVLRTGGTARALGGTVKAPSTLGTFLRSFRWGHVRQLDRVSRELLARAWAAGERRGASHGVSIRVTRGLYYRPSSFRSRSIEWEETVHAGTGMLGLTTKLIYFAGSRKRFRVRYDKIVAFEPFSDGFGIMRDAQTAKPRTFRTGDGWSVYNLAANLAQVQG